ncbi:hypothetical protein C8R45DRAFT_1123424 [Mycena sanguinolenta]|nr:hypothetical protein C8R45DRAFT_1123424 [Mycena sanguinolenta]
MISQLLVALGNSIISKWDRLSVLDYPYIRRSAHGNAVIRPLLESNRLRTLVVPSTTNLSWTYSAFKECPLESINIKRPVESWELERLGNDQGLLALLKYTKASAIGTARIQTPISELPLVAPSLNPFFIPMADAPTEVQDKIWARILYFAMSVPELANSPTSKDIPPRLGLLLVSKTFTRLGLSSYYAHVVIKQMLNIPKFASVLSRNPSIGPCVRSLTVDYWLYGYEEDGEESPAFYQIDCTILSQITGLVQLRQPSGQDWLMSKSRLISWEAFEAVAENSGSTLQEFSVRIGEQKQASAMMFSNLTALRILEWDSLSSFRLTNVPGDGLQNLKELHISLVDERFIFNGIIADGRVVLSTDESNVETFLEAHGPKLIELRISFSKLQELKVKILELCPNLQSLSLIGVGYVSTLNHIAVDDLYSSQAVPSLVKITFDLYFRMRDKDEVAFWDEFFPRFEPKCLPNLRDLEVKCCKWPTNE